MTLTTIQTASVVGFVLFALTFLGVAVAFVFYVWSGSRVGAKERTELYKLHWDQAIAVYPVMLIVSAIFAMLYMAQYLDQGFWVSGIELIPYLRWVMATIAGVGEMFLLCFIMIYHHKKHSVYWRIIVLAVYAFALSMFIAATLSPTGGQRIHWMVWSVLAFGATLGFLFFPRNLIRDAGYEMGVWQILFSEHTRPQKHNITELYLYAYRCVLLGQIVLSYVAYYIIWFLSSYNGFSGAIGLDDSTISLVVFDWLFVGPLFLLLCYVTYRGLTRKFVGKRRSDGHKMTVYGERKK